MDDQFLFGSLATVIERFDVCATPPGFGSVLMSTKYQWTGEREAERRSLELFQRKVAPVIQR